MCCKDTMSAQKQCLTRYDASSCLTPQGGRRKSTHSVSIKRSLGRSKIEINSELKMFFHKNIMLVLAISLWAISGVEAASEAPLTVAKEIPVKTYEHVRCYFICISSALSRLLKDLGDGITQNQKAYISFITKIRNICKHAVRGHERDLSERCSGKELKSFRGYIDEILRHINENRTYLEKVKFTRTDNAGNECRFTIWKKWRQIFQTAKEEVVAMQIKKKTLADFEKEYLKETLKKNKIVQYTKEMETFLQENQCQELSCKTISTWRKDIQEKTPKWTSEKLHLIGAIHNELAIHIIEDKVLQQELDQIAEKYFHHAIIFDNTKFGRYRKGIEKILTENKDGVNTCKWGEIMDKIEKYLVKDLQDVREEHDKLVHGTDDFGKRFGPEDCEKLDAIATKFLPAAAAVAKAATPAPSTEAHLTEETDISEKNKNSEPIPPRPTFNLCETFTPAAHQLHPAVAELPAFCQQRRRLITRLAAAGDHTPDRSRFSVPVLNDTDF